MMDYGGIALSLRGVATCRLRFSSVSSRLVVARFNVHACPNGCASVISLHTVECNLECWLDGDLKMKIQHCTRCSSMRLLLVNYCCQYLNRPGCLALHAKIMWEFLLFSLCLDMFVCFHRSGATA